MTPQAHHDAYSELTTVLESRVTLSDVLTYFSLPVDGDCPSGHDSQSHNCFHIFKDNAQLGYCFNCGKTFTAAKIVKLRLNCGGRDALKWLCETFAPDLLPLLPSYRPETPEQRTRREQRVKAAKAKADRERRVKAANDAAKRERRARRAQRIIRAVLSLRERAGVNSPYLTNKNLTIHDRNDAFVLSVKQLAAAGVTQLAKQWPDAAPDEAVLVVCMKDVSGRVVSLQFIAQGRKKLFLAGGAAKGAFLAYSSDGAAWTDCETFYMAEGLAKKLAVLKAAGAKTAALTVFSVNFYAAVLDALLTTFAPSDSLKTLRKTGVAGKTFVMVCDNDKAGRKAAAKLLRTHPCVKVTFADNPCKDADDLFRLGGVEAVRAMLARATADKRELTAQRYVLTPEQHLSDANLVLQDGLQWLIADTGLGKTRFVLQYAHEHPDEMVLLAAPVTGIDEQAVRELARQDAPFQLVMAGGKFAYDAAGLTVTTWASLAKKFDANECLYPVTLFVDEAHLLSSDVFRQKDIATLYEVMQHVNRAVLMTATPHFTHDCGLQHAPKTFVTQVGRAATRIQQLFYPSSEYAVIRHFAAQGRVVCEMNSKRGMAKMAKMLARDGVTGVLQMNADLKHDPDGVYRYIIDNEALPANCRVLLTTKLAETGLNIRDTDIQTVCVFAHKPLEVSRRPESIPLPHDCKQMANRFRACTPDVFLCLPACVDRERAAKFDGGREYARLRQRAKRQRAEYREDIAAGGFDMARASYEGALRETTPRLLTFDNHDCHILDCGLDMGACEQYGKLITYCGGFRKDELHKHGLSFAGDVMFDELTPAIDLTPEQAAAYLQISAEVKQDAEDAFIEDVDRLTCYTDKDLRLDDSPFAPRLLWLRKHFEQADAAAVLKTLGCEVKAFSAFKNRVNVLKGVWHKDTVRSAAAIDAFLQRSKMTGKDAAAMLTQVFQADKILRHELDDDWRNASKRPLSEKRALSILRKFADIDGRHRKTGAVYIVSDRHPLSTLFQQATGKQLADNEFFKNSIFANILPSLPTNRAEAGDTLQNEKLYSSAKTNVSPLDMTDDAAADYYGGLSDFARMQVATFGKVF